MLELISVYKKPMKTADKSLVLFVREEEEDQD